ncbi:MAG TPA: RagB/SusD family nutrient uptake outer membrane protein [Puia sp.]|nr:RagB/SusD family nutrient uptake outer membrane protein [Puia sp.]
MKTIYFAILIILLGSSCSKSFLDKTPVDQKVEEDFYKTPDDAFQALVSAYSILDVSGYGNIWLSSEITSDDCFGGAGTSDNGPRQWDKFQKYNDLNSDAWTKYYQGIYRANVFLQKVAGVNFGTNTALRDRYIGEAYFLRAYFYFDLVRMFENVPLLEQPIDGSNYYVPQANPDSVYALIASDLKQAVTKLTASSVTYSNIPTTEYGRATKWAAEALLAKTFLYYTGYYAKPDLVGAFSKQDAIAAIKDVVNNSGYGLVSNYASLWRSSSITASVPFAGQNNKEGVFSIQYSSQGLGNWSQQNGNRVQVMIALRGTVPAPYYKGWGFGTVSPALWSLFEPGDTIRKRASIISVADESLPYSPSTDQYQYTGYFWKKWSPMNQNNADGLGGNFQIDNFDNYTVIRFADILLMGAELNLASDLATAQTYYNAVRDRAFAGDATHRKTLTADANGLALILNERRLELALEGQRYWDLLRQGIPAAKAAIDNLTGDDFNVSFPSATRGLFAIPETQIGLSNGTLKQNTGW